MTKNELEKMLVEIVNLCESLHDMIVMLDERMDLIGEFVGLEGKKGRKKGRKVKK